MCASKSGADIQTKTRSVDSTLKQGTLEKMGLVSGG